MGAERLEPTVVKNVVLVSNTSWYLYNLRSNLIKRLIATGYSVTCVAPRDRFVPRLQGLGCGYAEVMIDSSGKNPFTELRTLFELYRIYSRLKPSVILHFTPKPNIYGSIAARILRAPVINNVAGLGDVFSSKGAVTHIVQRLYKLSQAAALRVFFQNPEDRDLFLGLRLVSPRQAEVLPGSGVDLARFAPREAASDTSVTRFLLAARLLWDKGIAEYVEAARRLSDLGGGVHFALAGLVEPNDPRYVTEEQLLQWQEAGQVKWLGPLDDVRPALAQADCVVLPSYYREGTPRILLEAASMAKPIITTDSVGCREVVDDGINGFLCQPRSSTDLARAMRAMIELTSDERRAMGQRGRQKMTHQFDEEIVIDRYLQSIREIVDREPRVGPA